MKAFRANIRISFNNDNSSYLRNSLANTVFKKLGFVNSPGKTRTGMWTKYPCTLQDMSNCMQQMWEKINSYSGKAKVDNYWCSFEEVEVDLVKFQNSIEKSEFDAEINKLGVISIHQAEKK